MAGSIIPMPVNGAADWSDFVTQCIKQRLGFMSVSLTNFDNDNEPQIAAGSVLDVSGSVYQFLAAESITGWSGIGNSNDVFIKVVPSGSSITAVFTTTAPVWDAAKGGWYESATNNRYIGGLYKDGSGNYTQKYVFVSLNKNIKEIKVFGTKQVEIGDGLRLVADALQPFFKVKILEIGDWNMDSTGFVNVAHGLTHTNIRGVFPFIRRDDDVNIRSFFDFGGGRALVNSTNIFLERAVGSVFDGTDFDATSFNRGWIILVYV